MGHRTDVLRSIILNVRTLPRALVRIVGLRIVPRRGHRIDPLRAGHVAALIKIDENGEMIVRSLVRPLVVELLTGFPDNLHDERSGRNVLSNVRKVLARQFVRGAAVKSSAAPKRGSRIIRNVRIAFMVCLASFGFVSDPPTSLDWSRGDGSPFLNIC